MKIAQDLEYWKKQAQDYAFKSSVLQQQIEIMWAAILGACDEIQDSSPGSYGPGEATLRKVGKPNDPLP
jgi:hypothetical protein